jgi:hypothetical protein
MSRPTFAPNTYVGLRVCPKFRTRIEHPTSDPGCLSRLCAFMAYWPGRHLLRLNIAVDATTEDLVFISQWAAGLVDGNSSRLDPYWTHHISPKYGPYSSITIGRIVDVDEAFGQVATELELDLLEQQLSEQLSRTPLAGQGR